MFYHGGPVITGEYIEVGKLIVHESSFGGSKGAKANYVYFTADRNVAIEYAKSHEDNGRLYIVYPTGKFENDPSRKDSWRSRSRLKIAEILPIKS